MNNKMILIIVTALIANLINSQSAAAQKSSAEVNARQVEKYQIEFVALCERQGQSRGNKAKYMKRFCNCALTKLKETTSQEQWLRAYSYSIKGQREAEMEIFASNANRIQECKSPSI